MIEKGSIPQAYLYGRGWRWWSAEVVDVAVVSLEWGSWYYRSRKGAPVLGQLSIVCGRAPSFWYAKLTWQRPIGSEKRPKKKKNKIC